MKSKIFNFLVSLIGIAIAAFGIVTFVVNTGITIGSATGVARIVQHFFGLSISTTVGIVNVTLLMLGLFVLGKSFFAQTVFCSLVYPVFIGFFENLECIKTIDCDPVVMMMCGALTIGGGMGLVIWSGASTGGTDIIAIILNKKFGVPLSPPMYLIDGVVILLQALIAENIETVFLGVIMTISYSVIAGIVAVGGNPAVNVIIVSEKYEEIREKLKELVVGFTMLNGETGYKEEMRKIVFCVVSKRDLVMIRDAVQKIDPAAFISISNANEVKGRGFSFDQGLRKEIRRQQQSVVK